MSRSALDDRHDDHPLLQLLLEAAHGRFPPVDGGVTDLPELDEGNRAVVSFTGHAAIASPLDVDTLSAASGVTVDGFGGALQPAVLSTLASGGSVGVIDVTLVARGLAGEPLGRTDLHDDHPRVAHARALRRNVEVFGDERGVITLADGLAGRREMSIELLEPGERPGLGRELIMSARHHVPPGTPLFAAVSPGNARSLRSFIAAGFVPIGSEVIIDMAPSTSPSS